MQGILQRYFEMQEGRSDERWVDFDFFGHQLVIHQKEGFMADKPISNQ